MALYRDHLPVECTLAAAACGNLQMLMWIRENGGDWNNQCYDKAARNGHVHIMTYLYESGCEIPRSIEAFIYRSAIYGGHANVLQWLCDHKLPLPPLDASVHAAVGEAAESGYVDVLKWLASVTGMFTSTLSFALANSCHLFRCEIVARRYEKVHIQWGSSRRSLGCA